MSEEPFERMLYNDAQPRETSPSTVVMVPLDVYLDDLEAERDALIMRLRQVEKPLVKYGRLKGETLPRRVR